MTTILEGTFTEVNEEETATMNNSKSLFDKVIFNTKKLYETTKEFVFKAKDKVDQFLSDHQLDGLIKKDSDTSSHVGEAFKTGVSVGAGVVTSAFFGFGLLGMTFTTMITFITISYAIAFLTRKSFKFVDALLKAMKYTVIVPAVYLLGMYIPVALFF